MEYEIDNKPSLIDWECVGVDRVLQNAKNLLRTEQGEVPYARDRGLDPSLYHTAISEVKKNIHTELETLYNLQFGGRYKKGEAELIDGGLYIKVVIEVEE